MRKLSRILALGSILLFTAPTAKAQAIKTNLPLLLAGTPNVGVEFMLSQQFTMNADILWMPYMFKKHEEVFRALIGSVDMRYYVKPRYYYTNNMYDGFTSGLTSQEAISISDYGKARTKKVTAAKAGAFRQAYHSAISSTCRNIFASI